MNLTDIEKAVVELSLRHPSLTKEFLRTLLEASGWEEKHIKEAQIIYAAHLSATSPTPLVPEAKVEPIISREDSSPALPSILENSSSKTGDITFLRSDGTEEGELHVEEVSGVQKREVKEVIVPQVREEEVEEKPNMPTVLAPAEPPAEEKVPEKEPVFIEKQEKSSLKVEEQSLIQEDFSTPREKSKTWLELPDNLPLVPFESAPHVWSFGRYKDTFYQEEKVEEKKTQTVTTTTTYSEEKKPEPLPVIKEETLPRPIIIQPVVPASPPQREPEVEIDYEKTPITMGEESLVVLAGIMLLAIMLILGYMYGNGRL